MMKVPAHVREQQINNLPNITFIRWDGEYEGVFTKAICQCDAGHVWSMRVNNLVNIGSGCSVCAHIKRAAGRRIDPKIRIDQINAIPGVEFVRWESVYRNSHSKAICRCLTHGCEWSITVNGIITKERGCPECARSCYNVCESATLYALRSECGAMVKIGVSNDYVTRHAVLKRRTPFAFHCIELIHGDGAFILSLEKAFHGMTEPVTFSEPFDGYTEWRKWTPELVDWFNMWREMT